MFHFFFSNEYTKNKQIFALFFLSLQINFKLAIKIEKKKRKSFVRKSVTDEMIFISIS